MARCRTRSGFTIRAATAGLLPDAYSFLLSFSSDGKKIYYIVRAAGGLLTPYGGLWVTDLGSGQRRRRLPKFQIGFYSLSRDGKRVVFASPKEAGRPGVWLAALDGSSAPRQLTTADGINAFFAPDGYVIYTAIEKDGYFVYRSKQDGSDVRKVISRPVFFLSDVSPDGKYVMVSEAASTEETGSGAAKMYPVEGGDASTGPAVFAFPKFNSQRNIFRVPAP